MPLSRSRVLWILVVCFTLTRILHIVFLPKDLLRFHGLVGFGENSIAKGDSEATMHTMAYSDTGSNTSTYIKNLNGPLEQEHESDANVTDQINTMNQTSIRSTEFPGAPVNASDISEKDNTNHQQLHTSAQHSVGYTRTKDSCFTPHPYFRPPSIDGPLPTPIISVGFPKAGTSSLRTFFNCGGRFNASHFRCHKGNETMHLPNRQAPFCGGCMKTAIENGQPPLSSCGNYGAFMQMDKTISRRFCYWPQIQGLEEIHLEAPNATFVLNTRNVTNWYNSLKHWGRYHQRIGSCKNLPGGHPPQGPGSSFENMTNFFCNHVEFIRQFVLEHPSHALVEVDIEDVNAGDILSRYFKINETCWGHANLNNRAH